MAKRRAIGKKDRFEVFKRDSFTCQYCGKAAPDVVLNVDHLKPVSKGGDNELVNLVTACQECNNGKSNRDLDDGSTVAKQKAQLDELNTRREQLEMMLQWRDGMKDIKTKELEAFENAFAEHTGNVFTESESNSAKRWIKRYGLKVMLESLDEAVDRYLKPDEEGNPDSESITQVFEKTPSIAYWQSKGGMPDELKDAYYCRGILRRRLNYCNDVMALKLITDALAIGVDGEILKTMCKEVCNWTEFRDTISEWIAKREAA